MSALKEKGDGKGGPAPRYRHWRKSILFRTAILSWCIIILTLGIYVLSIIPHQRQQLIDELHTRGNVIATSLAQVAATAILLEDYSFVVDHCNKVVAESPSILYVVITRQDGFSLVYTEKSWQQQNLDGFWLPLDNDDSSGQFIENSLVNAKVFHYAHPFSYSGIDGGWIHIGLSLEKFSDKLMSVYVWTLWLAMICMAAGFVLSFIFARRLTHPILLLNNVIKDVAAGDLSARAVLSSGDEVESLAMSFNRMTEALQTSREALRTSEEKYRCIVENTNDVIMLARPDGVSTYVSPASKKVLGYNSDELVDKDAVMGLVHPDDRAHVKASFSQTLKNATSTAFEYRIIDKEGTTRWISHSWAPIAQNNALQLTVSVLRDITEHKKAEEELKTLNEGLISNEKALKNMFYDLRHSHNQLKNAQQQLIQSEKLAAIGQLATGIAHEINNPLGFIASNLATLGKYLNSLVTVLQAVDILKEAVKQNDRKKAIETIRYIAELEESVDFEYIVSDATALITESKVGIERIKRIVVDLRKFSRMDDDERTPSNLNELLEGVLTIVMNEIKYKADLSKEYGEIPFIECNEQQLGQVFINMFINAVQAIEDRGRIFVKTYAQNNHVYVEIADSGCGMSDEVRGKIFDPFFTTKAAGVGTGLGLSISHDIVQRHNGTIEVTSEKKKGTRFTVSFPALHAGKAVTNNITTCRQNGQKSRTARNVGKR